MRLRPPAGRVRAKPREAMGKVEIPGARTVNPPATRDELAAEPTLHRRGQGACGREASEAAVVVVVGWRRKA